MTTRYSPHPGQIMVWVIVVLGGAMWLAGLAGVEAQETVVPAQGETSSNGSVPTIQVTTRLVILDVVVNDRHGHPVKGLKQSDFTLTEDGVPQTLISATEHNIADDAPTTSPEFPLSPNTFSVQPPVSDEIPKTVIVFGQLTYEHAPFLRQQVEAYMKTMAPGTPICIFRIDWQGVHLVQSLTTDPRILLEAAGSQRNLPPLGFQTRYLHRVGDPLRELVGYLSAIPGRINLIWIADDGALIPALFPESDLVNPTNNKPLDTGDKLFTRDPSSQVFPDLAALIHEMDGGPRGRVAVYPIQAQGVPTSLLVCQSLMEMANSTGGKAYCNTNGFEEAVADAIDQGSHFYTLSYHPTNPLWNGAFRKIKVDVGSALQETSLDKFSDWLDYAPRVVYREGYFARDTPQEVLKAPLSSAAIQHGVDQGKAVSYSPGGNPGTPGSFKPTPINAAMTLAAPTPAQIHFHVAVTPSSTTHQIPSGSPMPRGNFLATEWRSQPYRNVLLHYSVSPEDLRFAEDGKFHRDSLEFIAVLYRDDGGVVNSFSHPVPISVDADAYNRLLSAPLALDQTIAIPVAGNYYIRTAIHELPTDRIGALEIPTEWIKLPSPQSAKETSKH